MGKTPWTTTAQHDYLASLMPEFIWSKGNKLLRTDFLTKLHSEWFARWPEPEPSPETVAKFKVVDPQPTGSSSVETVPVTRTDEEALQLAQEHIKEPVYKVCPLDLNVLGRGLTDFKAPTGMVPQP